MERRSKPEFVNKATPNYPLKALGSPWWRPQRTSHPFMLGAAAPCPAERFPNPTPRKNGTHNQNGSRHILKWKGRYGSMRRNVLPIWISVGKESRSRNYTNRWILFESVKSTVELRVYSGFQWGDPWCPASNPSDLNQPCLNLHLLAHLLLLSKLASPCHFLRVHINCTLKISNLSLSPLRSESSASRSGMAYLPLPDQTTISEWSRKTCFLNRCIIFILRSHKLTALHPNARKTPSKPSVMMLAPQNPYLH